MEKSLFIRPKMETPSLFCLDCVLSARGREGWTPVEQEQGLEEIKESLEGSFLSAMLQQLALVDSRRVFLKNITTCPRLEKGRGGGEGKEVNLRVIDTQVADVCHLLLKTTQNQMVVYVNKRSKNYNVYGSCQLFGLRNKTLPRR